MIQVGKFGDPWIKVLQGHPLAIDHGALIKSRFFAFQDVANGLSDNSARTDGFGQQARLDHIPDGKNLLVRGLVAVTDFYKAFFSGHTVGNKLQIRHIANRNNDGIGRQLFSRCQFHTGFGNFLGKYRPHKFGCDCLGCFSFFAERSRFLNIQQNNFLGAQTIGFGSGITAHIAGSDDDHILAYFGFFGFGGL